MLAQEFEVVLTREDWDTAAARLNREAMELDLPPSLLGSDFYCSHCAVGLKANKLFPGFAAEFCGSLSLGPYWYCSDEALELAIQFDKMMDGKIYDLPDFPVTLRFSLERSDDDDDC